MGGQSRAARSSACACALCAQNVDKAATKHVGRSASRCSSTAEWCAPAARASLTSCASVNAHSLRPPTGRPAGPSCGRAGRPQSSLPPLGVPDPSGRYLGGRIPRASEGARPPQCLEPGAREPIMPALTRCSRLSRAGTTALGGPHGHSSGRRWRRGKRRCGWRARSAGGAGGGRRGGRARARGAVLGLAMCWSRGGPCGQVRAVVSGAPGSFGPAPGRSGPARGSSLAVPRVERASGACLRAARGRSCAKMRTVRRIWCEYVGVVV